MLDFAPCQNACHSIAVPPSAAILISLKTRPHGCGTIYCSWQALAASKLRNWLLSWLLLATARRTFAHSLLCCLDSRIPPTFVTRVLNLLLSVDVIVYLFRFSHSSGSLKNAFETSHTQYEPRCVLPLPSLWGLCVHCNCAMHPHTFILSETQCHCPEAYSDSCAVFVWKKWAFVITELDCIAS